MRTITAYSDHILTYGDRQVRCALGKAGIAFPSNQMEGDGASPAGKFPIRCVHYRKDRVGNLETALEKRKITPGDAWCDAPDHEKYNRRVQLPFEASHERLWREDHVYDVIVQLGFNDDPVVPGKGSAIFFHIKRDDYRPTLGCVAISLEDMLDVLKWAQPGDIFEINRSAFIR
ncbi:MAG: L,D-transpeptidase family protein [Pseudomonadota bacterium]